MRLGDRIQETAGKAKENADEAVGSQDLRAEGQGDRMKGGVGQIISNAEEKLGDVTGSVANKVEGVKDRLTGE